LCFNNTHTAIQLQRPKILTQQGAPTLIIGHHELKGTAITLKEPFAVLRKRKFQPDDENENERKLLKRHGEAKVQYEVAGVVKKKLMFDQYPKSIMR
jgi:hypothetical protein